MLMEDQNFHGAKKGIQPKDRRRRAGKKKSPRLNSDYYLTGKSPAAMAKTVTIISPIPGITLMLTCIYYLVNGD